ncbi:TetR/AcrR family transcriptional regulator [Desulfatitalea tepidiphila]|uniref:TetR/AcrR family transcriptional regulator n=1 Tax=Desulfatitalea tepidiphila TaxID=1185843 RepID=UPI0006B57AC3|nr:TetR/AcrR family transcriptional regulator [Desulfatitalea tepidiphila]
MATAATTFAHQRKKERLERQNVILCAAERVYGRKPFETVSMRDIANEAGIAVSSLYRYFPDQRSLFVAAFVAGTRQIIARVDARISKGKITDLTAFGLEFISFLTENDHYFRMMTHFMLDGRLTGRPLEQLNDAARAVLDLFERVLDHCGAGRHKRALAHACFAALNGVLITFRNYPGRDSAEVRRHMDRIATIMAEALEGYGRLPVEVDR